MTEVETQFESDFDWANDAKRRWRREKLNYFLENILPALEKKYKVAELENDKFIIFTEWNKLAYYPKSNSLYNYSKRYWVKGYGLNWIKKYLLNNIKLIK